MKRRSFLGILFGLPIVAYSLCKEHTEEYHHIGYVEGSDLPKGEQCYEFECKCSCTGQYCVPAYYEEVGISGYSGWAGPIGITGSRGYKGPHGMISKPKQISRKRNVRHQFQRR